MNKFILTASSGLGISKGVVGAQEIMWLKLLGVSVGEGTLHLQVSYNGKAIYKLFGVGTLLPLTLKVSVPLLPSHSCYI